MPKKRKKKPPSWVGGEPDWNAVERYIWRLQSILRLQGWQLYLIHAPCDSKFEATIQTSYGRIEANIALCSSWNTRTPEQQRHTLVHELLHLIFRPIENALRHSTDFFDEQAKHILNEIYVERTEYAIEAICLFLMPHLPLPEGKDQLNEPNAA